MNRKALERAILEHFTNVLPSYKEKFIDEITKISNNKYNCCDPNGYERDIKEFILSNTLCSEKALKSIKAIYLKDEDVLLNKFLKYIDDEER